jgi:hypothetical protein
MQYLSAAHGWRCIMHVKSQWSEYNEILSGALSTQFSFQSVFIKLSKPNINWQCD